MTRQNAQEGPQMALGTIEGVARVRFDAETMWGKCGRSTKPPHVMTQMRHINVRIL